VESTIKNGKEEKYEIGNPTKVFEKNTANILKDALKLVIEEGTGKLAKASTVTAGGKTATAQTGKYKNNKEINSSWFCGFFPFQNPKYVVVIFCEDNSLQTKSCAQIFAQIADKITVLP
jgi:penicillin-binding protein 2